MNPTNHIDDFINLIRESTNKVCSALEECGATPTQALNYVGMKIMILGLSAALRARNIPDSACKEITLELLASLDRNSNPEAQEPATASPDATADMVTDEHKTQSVFPLLKWHAIATQGEFMEHVREYVIANFDVSEVPIEAIRGRGIEATITREMIQFDRGDMLSARIRMCIYALTARRKDHCAVVAFRRGEGDAVVEMLFGSVDVSDK